MPFVTIDEFLAQQSADVAARLEQLRLNQEFLHGAPRALVFRSTNQAITTDTGTNIIFDTVVGDSQGLWTAADPTKLTIPTDGDGLYIVGSRGTFDSNATGRRIWVVRRNGTGEIGRDERPAHSGASSATMARVASLVAGDYIELRAFQSSGGNLDVTSSASAETPSLFAAWIGGPI